MERVTVFEPVGRPAVLVHGGAWAIPAPEHGAHLDGCRAAADAGWAVLAAGGSALDAAVAAVVVMEDDPTYDAGRGSFLNRDGAVEMDAAVMRGEDLAFGAVASVRRVRNAVHVARAVLESGEATLVAGAGAERFAWSVGIERIDPSWLVVERERERYDAACARGAPTFTETFGDTVGAVAVDASGRVAAAGSTGGTPFKLPGRVGDTPIAGAGLLADDTAGAAAATGHGERILKTGLCRDALWRLDAMPLDASIAAALERLRRRADGRAGMIVVTPDGKLAAGYNTPAMAHAYRAAGMPTAVAAL